MSMDIALGKNRLAGLAKKIVSDNLLNEEQVYDAIAKSEEARKSFISYLIEKNLVDSKILAYSISNNFGLPLVNLAEYDPDYFPKNVVRDDIILKHNVIPIYKRNNELFIAVADPTNQTALDEIKFYTGLQVHAVLTEANLLSKFIENIQSAQGVAALSELENVDLDGLALNNEEEEKEGSAIAVSSADDAPIIRFVNKIILDAINKNASDIHFEPYEKKYRVRMRIDGLLFEAASPPVTLANRIAARIKIMSRLDISERRIPQDGRFKINLSANRSIDFRVNTCPTVSGEKIVIRILDPGSAKIGVDALGFEPFQKELFLKVLNQPQGMILVTGPTGSGKTVTLYTALNILNKIHSNISTVEDPVEIHVPGINQVNINLKAGLTFATALRAFLRQDPDIIMVGEMRDLETAEIGVKAAQTGHLVLSTLHTNSAPESLTRLSNMGLPAYNIATSVSLIIAQRLTRRLCSHCKILEKLPAEVLIAEGFSEEIANTLQVYGPNVNGCEYCNHGYKGRVGIYEVLPISKDISNAILSGMNSLEILKLAKQNGMNTLRESGLLKVQQGLTSLEEVNRVSKD